MKFVFNFASSFCSRSRRSSSVSLPSSSLGFEGLTWVVNVDSGCAWNWISVHIIPNLIFEQQLKRIFPRPEINFKLRGKSAGTAHLHQNLLRFNAILLAENQDAFFNEVIPHEICHLLAHQMYGRVKPHGQEWQALMIQVFKLTPSTTHSMNTQSVAGQHFSYQCDCGPVSLSIRRHNKVVRGETQYRCRRCKKALIHQQ